MYIQHFQHSHAHSAYFDLANYNYLWCLYRFFFLISRFLSRFSLNTKKSDRIDILVGRSWVPVSIIWLFFIQFDGCVHCKTWLYRLRVFKICFGSAIMYYYVCSNSSLRACTCQYLLCNQLAFYTDITLRYSIDNSTIYTL